MGMDLTAVDAALNLEKFVNPHALFEPIGFKRTLPWTYYVYMAGSAVGVVTTVAAGILGDRPIIVAGAIITVISLTAAYDVRRLAITKTLEEYIKRLAKLAQDFFQITQKTDKIIEESKSSEEKLRKDLEKARKDHREAAADVDKQLARVQSLVSYMEKKKVKLPAGFHVEEEQRLKSLEELLGRIKTNEGNASQTLTELLIREEQDKKDIQKAHGMIAALKTEILGLQALREENASLKSEMEQIRAQQAELSEKLKKKRSHGSSTSHTSRS